jgi:prepilin-type N-terminal cleavage/methylation domain-containing protein
MAVQFWAGQEGVLPLTSAMDAAFWVPPVYGTLLIKCNSLSRLGVLSGNRRSGPDGCRSKMILNAKFVSPSRSPRNGFSLVELVLSLAVLLVITTLAIPVVVRSLQTYQLNSTASQLAGMLKFTKFDAIRQNTHVNFQIVQIATNWVVWADSNGDGAPDGAEPQMVLPIGGNDTLLPQSSVPSPSPIAATLGSGGTPLPWTVLSGANASIMYDQRGVVVSGAGGAVVSTVYAFYLGNPNDPNAGYRAVITLPSGAVQVWTSSSAGNWQRIS